jgi:hypothetical protein
MKSFLLTLTLVLLSACTNYHAGDKWAEKAASKWAATLGRSDAPVSCLSYIYEFGKGDKDAYCSVNMGDRIYRIYCWVDNDTHIIRCEQRGE